MKKPGLRGCRPGFSPTQHDLKPGQLALAERGAFNDRARPSSSNVRSRIKFQGRFKALRLAHRIPRRLPQRRRRTPGRGLPRLFQRRKRLSDNSLIEMEEAASQRHQSHREDRQDGNHTHYMFLATQT